MLRHITIRLLVCFLLQFSMQFSNIHALHSEEPTSYVNSFQCNLCNASYYCSGGVRYPCPPNSLAIEYADQVQECICNPGYVGVGEGPPRQIPATLTYDFYTSLFPACRYCPNDAQFPFPQYAFDMPLRLKLWLDYAASIGATTNINAIGSRVGNYDDFGFTGVYANGQATPPNDLFFRLRLSREYTRVTVIYKAFKQYIHLYINDVLQQSCGPPQINSWSTPVPQECIYTTAYSPGSILELRGNGDVVFIGENLKFLFTHPQIPFACELGLSPDWYLYGQRNTCPATKGVAANGSSSVQDCVCLPGYVIEGPALGGDLSDADAALYTACSPCPAGTYSGFNSSECTPCPGNSSHNNTKQTSISACLCNAGWAGVAANGCVECAAGNFSRKNGSAACQVCGSNSNTYDYPRTECKCNKGFTPTVTVLNPPDSSRAYSSFGGNSGSSSMINSIRGWQGGNFKGDGRFDWLQMDLGQETLVAGVAIQASLICPYNGCQFVTQIGVQYATSSSQFYDAKSSTGALRFYPVSTTSNPVIDELLFDVPVWAQYIRITMYDWTTSSYAATRAGVLMWSGNCQNCPSNTFKDYTGFLRDKACTPCQQYSTSLPGSPSQDLCICNLGYFLNNASNSGSGCRGCDAGMYRTNNSCHNCPVASTSKVGSARIEDCICIPGYSGPNGGPCVACDVGKYKAINGSSSCIDCPLHTWTDETNMTVCKSCKEFLKSPGGETESTAQNTSESCFCRPGYINNGTNGTRSCAPCDPGNYSLDKNLAECTACPQHTYTDPALFPWDLTSDCRVCKLCNTSTNAAFTDHYDAARGGLGCGEASVEVCTQCPLLSSLFRRTKESDRNFGVRSCVCDENSYGLVGSACTACPAGQVRPDFLNANTTLADCLCAAGFEPDPAAANLCRQCPIGKYKPELGDHNCTVCPDTFTTEITGNSNFASCVCRPGYALSADQLCVICPENTYKVGFNMNTTCPLCPSNSLVAAGAVSHSDCTCVVGFEPYNNVCNLCPTGKYGNISINIGIAMSALASAGYQNLARACSSGACPVSTSTPHPGIEYAEVNLVDGIFSNDNNWFHSNIAFQVWVLIDMQETVDVQTVRVYNRRGGVESNRLQNFEIRIGNDATFLNNAVCVTAQSTFPDVKDFTCPMKGRYLSLQNGGYNYLNLRELEVWGKKIVPIFECLVCPQNTFTNNTGALICEACAAGKTTAGRTGQVECVCDVGLEHGTDGECVTCPAGRYKATSTDKYANRACVTCGSCAANQQVNTECNNTHDVTCRACQANSWSYAGRTELELCLCNAGYELQGQLCVACAVGKARQVNNSNSIVCETCGAGTFTSVSASITCGVCSGVCADNCPEVIYDFSKVALGQPWKDYAAAIGFPTNTMFSWYSECGGWMGQWNNNAWMQGTLTAGYTYLEVTFYACQGNVVLSIDGVSKAISYGDTVVYQQKYSAGQTLRLQEFSSGMEGGIGKNLKIRLIKPCTILYVKNECNASRDVICQECQTCGPGFYANNTCGVNYNNDRLDTQCAACPAGYQCPGGSVSQVAISCADNRCAANQQVATLCNATHNVTCKACQANSWSYAGRTELGPCLCNAGYELQGGLCVACPVGKARQANYNNSIVCETCAVGTFTSVSTSITCKMCSALCGGPPPARPWCDPPMSTCKTLTYNFKGYYSLASWLGYANSVGAYTYGFTDSIGNQGNTVCQTCGVYGNPEPTKAAYIEFTLPVGYDLVHVSAPHGQCCLSVTINNQLKKMCNTCEQNRICSQCVGVGSVEQCQGPPTGYASPGCDYQQVYTPGQKLRITEHNGIIGYDLKLTFAVFPDLPYGERYVNNECNASRDVICQECQTCGMGFYANNTCGANYSNGRLDTQCAVCPAGSYCPTGLGPPIPCPNNGQSLPGSISDDACDCDPGYFRDVDGCKQCFLDTYCPGEQVQHAISCPPMSRTIARGSTMRMDCHCQVGYFRDPPSDETSFNCSLCLPGDFCFNNSAYNCSDELMHSEAGSGFPDNCTCVSGFYNNGSRCENCPAGYFCENGLLLACAENEWTAGQERVDVCLCKPGFYRPNSSDLCVPCTDNYFCDGTDDAQHACPANAVSHAATHVQYCLCDVSFQAIFSSNMSEPHSCQQCSNGETFKSSVGNTACTPCSVCTPQTHSTWTQIVCTPGGDSLCDTCSVCHNTSLTEVQPQGRSKYATHECQQFFDTMCGNCTVCNASEWQLEACAETQDTKCAPINFHRTCPIGFYTGGHTAVTDSLCLPCAVRNMPYQGMWLHEFTSAGQIYNDPFSCQINCLHFSRLTNISNMSFGCTTCETGNVLFKSFTQNLFECRFECLHGYVLLNGDCVLGPMSADENTFWNHSINVTHVQRAEQHNGSTGAFLFTVTHTDHGRFAVVIGKSEPTCSGLSKVSLRAPSRSACCFSELWRVSTTSQLGLAGTTPELCSRHNPPWSELRSNTQLVFEVPDTRIEELANCSQVKDDGNETEHDSREEDSKEEQGGLSCELYVSIVDTKLLLHFFVVVQLRLTRASAMSAVGTQTYVPLDGIRVEVQLAYRETDGTRVFVVNSDMQPLLGAGVTDVRLFATGLTPVQSFPQVDCSRLISSKNSNVTFDAWTLGSEGTRATTFLRLTESSTQGLSDTVFIKIFYTLRLREREASSTDTNSTVKNIMHVAVWRNVSTTQAACVQVQEKHLQVSTGNVVSCSGLGHDAVASATRLLEPTDTVHGALGGLTSFVAMSTHAHVRSVKIVSMLLAFALPPTLILANATHMHMGVLDFTEDFRTACLQTPLCHFQHAYQGALGFEKLHFMTKCDSASQDAARAWLTASLGVVHDAAHVMALCSIVARQSPPDYAFLITLVNTRAFLPKSSQWHDLHNHSAPVSTSKVFALFDFV
jgi:hypothetical protein